MTYLYSIILGIVEGITEFLPISSTGHLILTSKLLSIPDSEFLKSFEIFIQLGAILAVVYYYRRTICSDFIVWKKVIAAFIPTAVFGFILYKIVKHLLLGNALIVAYALIIGGIILIIFEIYQKKKTSGLDKEITQYDSIREVPYMTAIYIGIAQVLAVIPGVSRSATTIIAGQSLSLSRKAVIEFSFLLAIPTMLAATSLDMIQSGRSFSGQEFIFLALGFIIAFFTALAVIKWLLLYVRDHSFIVFGIYRIIIGLIVLFAYLVI